MAYFRNLAVEGATMTYHQEMLNLLECSNMVEYTINMHDVDFRVDL